MLNTGTLNLKPEPQTPNTKTYARYRANIAESYTKKIESIIYIHISV
jgi:hypothetical protein